MIYYSANDLDAEFAAHILRYYWYTEDELALAPASLMPFVDIRNAFILRQTTDRLICQLAYDFCMMCKGGGLRDYQYFKHHIYRCQLEPEVLTLFADGYRGKFQYMETKPAFCYFEHDRNWTQYLKDDGIVCGATYAEKGLEICSTQKQSAVVLSTDTRT